MTSSRIAIKRAYDRASRTDGLRVLVDRIWPRGVSKSTAKIDCWMKDLAPSQGLRKQFHEAGVTWPAFAGAYRAELRRAPAKDMLDQLRQLAATRKVTLVFASRDGEHNNASVLRDILTSS